MVGTGQREVAQLANGRCHAILGLVAAGDEHGQLEGVGEQGQPPDPSRPLHQVAPGAGAYSGGGGVEQAGPQGAAGIAEVPGEVFGGGGPRGGPAGVAVVEQVPGQGDVEVGERTGRGSPSGLLDASEANRGFADDAQDVEAGGHPSGPVVGASGGSGGAQERLELGMVALGHGEPEPERDLPGAMAVHLLQAAMCADGCTGVASIEGEHRQEGEGLGMQRVLVEHTVEGLSRCGLPSGLQGGFDERDPAVKKLLGMAIAACKARGKYVGICGQGPSDHTDFAEWLVEEGIDSVSLNPDTVVDTWLRLAGPAGGAVAAVAVAGAN